MAMLQISRLTKRFREREVLRGVSLELQAGHVGVLIGPSGSGKSTLLRCVNGLEVFDTGEIEAAGGRLQGGAAPAQRLQQLSRIRKHVGMVFQ
jgi:polar amino acid transport system ATP-binding protein